MSDILKNIAPGAVTPPSVPKVDEKPAMAPTVTDTPPEPTEETVKVRILRDKWDEMGNRLEKGRILDIPIRDAFDGVERGTMERYKKDES